MKLSLFLLAGMFPFLTNAAPQHNAAPQPKTYELKSPNGVIVVRIVVDGHIHWSVDHKGDAVIVPSVIGLQLEDGETLGDNARILAARSQAVNTSMTPLNYKKATIKDQYDQLTLNCKGDYSIVFRAYDDAVAYRFVTNRKSDLLVKNEEANFNFANDDKAFIPIQWDYRVGKTFNSSFEALYHEINLSQFPKDSLAFLPLLVDIGDGKKVAILEADLDDYPGKIGRASCRERVWR